MPLHSAGTYFWLRSSTALLVIINHEAICVRVRVANELGLNFPNLGIRAIYTEGDLETTC